jgi:hypothetical protein
MSPADEAFDPSTATDEQLTLFLARQGVQPTDLRKSLDAALERVGRTKEEAKAKERPWEEFELERVDSIANRP